MMFGIESLYLYDKNLTRRRRRTEAYWRKKGVVNQFKISNLIRRYGLKSDKVLNQAGV